jgi:transcriptional regulator with XRE-family HTH domain
MGDDPLNLDFLRSAFCRESDRRSAIAAIVNRLSAFRNGIRSVQFKIFQKSFRNFSYARCNTAFEESTMAHEASYVRWSLEGYGIGTKLRGLRTRKRLTLSRLAAETGLSTALLSKLETDRMVPTLPTLVTICRVFGVGLSYFFCEPSRHTLSITRRAQWLSKGSRRESIKFTPLHPPAIDAPLTAQVIDLAPDGTAHTPTITGQARSLLYVLEGKLLVECGGTQETFAAGDFAYIDTQMPMTWRATGKEHCHVLAVGTTALQS